MSSEDFRLLRKTSDFFGNVRKRSCHLQKSQHSQDKNLTPISQKKLAGIHCTKESTWLITIHYQTSSFQVKPLSIIRCSRKCDKNSCLMLSNPLASSSLPKREVRKCFKSSSHTMLHMFARNQAKFSRNSITSVQRSFCKILRPARETLIPSQKILITLRSL